MFYKKNNKKKIAKNSIKIPAIPTFNSNFSNTRHLHTDFAALFRSEKFAYYLGMLFILNSFQYAASSSAEICNHLIFFCAAFLPGLNSVIQQIPESSPVSVFVLVPWWDGKLHQTANIRSSLLLQIPSGDLRRTVQAIPIGSLWNMLLCASFVQLGKCFGPFRLLKSAASKGVAKKWEILNSSGWNFS